MRISFGLCLPRDEATVPVVRHLLGGALRKLGISEVDVSDIELALTEASTNVLRHTAEVDDDYEVTVDIEDSSCEIRVTDSGGGFDHAGPSGPTQPSAESGRGIQLMRGLVDAVNFVSRPQDGTIVRLVKDLEIQQGSPLARLVSQGSG